MTVNFHILDNIKTISTINDSGTTIVGKFKLNYKKVIETGSYATVYEGEFIKSKIPVAIKVIPKTKISNLRKKTNLEQEISLLEELKNSSKIVKLHNTYVDDEAYYLVFERLFCDLYNHLETPMNEKTAKQVFKKILLGVKELHDKDIVHRDLKLENILVSKDLSVVKICDLGYSKKTKGRSLWSRHGSAHTIAPEVLKRKGYQFEVDIWALGCILHALLTQEHPFFREGDDLNDLIWRIIKNDRVPLSPDLSEDAQDLINSLLTVDTSLRPKINQVLLHPWLN